MKMLMLEFLRWLASCGIPPTAPLIIMSMLTGALFILMLEAWEMRVKKYNGKIYGAEFTAQEQKAVDAEINRQLIEQSRKFEIDEDSCILAMLHEEFGFGKTKLRRAWELFYNQRNKLRDEYYLQNQGDGEWLCRQQLKAIGVDLEKWYSDIQENVADL